MFKKMLAVFIVTVALSVPVFAQSELGWDALNYETIDEGIQLATYDVVEESLGRSFSNCGLKCENDHEEISTKLKVIVNSKEFNLRSILKNENGTLNMRLYSYLKATDRVIVNETDEIIQIAMNGSENDIVATLYKNENILVTNNEIKLLSTTLYRNHLDYYLPLEWIGSMGHRISYIPYDCKRQNQDQVDYLYIR